MNYICNLDPQESQSSLQWSVAVDKSLCNKQAKPRLQHDLASFQIQIQTTLVAECQPHTSAVTLTTTFPILARVNWVTCVSDEQVQGIYNTSGLVSACIQHNGNHHWWLPFIFVLRVGLLTHKPSQAFKEVLSTRLQVLFWSFFFSSGLSRSIHHLNKEVLEESTSSDKNSNHWTSHTMLA